jgi:hypothetical protein
MGMEKRIKLMSKSSQEDFAEVSLQGLEHSKKTVHLLADWITATEIELKTDTENISASVSAMVLTTMLVSFPDIFKNTLEEIMEKMKDGADGGAPIILSIGEVMKYYAKHVDFETGKALHNESEVREEFKKGNYAGLSKIRTTTK